MEAFEFEAVRFRIEEARLWDDRFWDDRRREEEDTIRGTREEEDTIRGTCAPGQPKQQRACVLENPNPS